MPTNFVTRLTNGMIKKGFASNTAKIGVQAAPLANYLSVSVQMIRKYFSGETVPDINTIIKISKFLDVCPAWLTFGISANSACSENKFHIKKQFIDEIFNGLFQDVLGIKIEPDLEVAITNFLYGIINDIGQLDADDKMKSHLIKTAVSSASILGTKRWKPLTIQA